MNKYELPVGLYHIQKESVPLKNFDIFVTVIGFKDDSSNMFAENKRLSSYLGNTFKVLEKKIYDFKILNGTKEENLDPTIFNIKFSKIGFDNFNIDKFIQQIKVADVTE